MVARHYAIIAIFFVLLHYKTVENMNWRALFFLFTVCSVLASAQSEWGIINVSVCNTRDDADYTAGMESQGLLGMPVQVLDESDGWLKVRTPEDYESWALASCVKTCSREELTQWNTARQVVVTALFGQTYERPSRKSQPVSDVVAGNRLALKGKTRGFYRVEYPDGRQAYLPRRDAMPLAKWRARLDKSPEAIIATAHRMMGLPYMWGGMSTKGVDCSGFVRMALYMHDIIVPRNASQMARVGERIEVKPDFSNLVPGDLLYFSFPNQTRVIHVAIYMGNRRFIHSLGCVHVGSFDPADPLYDAEHHATLLYAGRLLPYVNTCKEIFTTDQSEYYK